MLSGGLVALALAGIGGAGAIMQAAPDARDSVAASPAPSGPESATHAQEQPPTTTTPQPPAGTASTDTMSLQVGTPPVGTLPPGAEPGSRAGSGRVLVLVEMQQRPAAVVYAEVLEQAAARSAQTTAAAANAARTQIAAIDAQQQPVAAAMAGAPFNATELFRVRRAMNGIAATVDATDLNALKQLPGVKAVHLVELEYPTNATSVPFLGTPAVWAGALGVPLPATGAGVRLGVIDTGIDYQHATFGGTGLLADYQANDRTAAPDAFFPSAKVVGGFDFAGDAYTGGAGAPVPDPDPMDCNGHGTHVAGTAAGFGVSGDGTTFAGPFGPSAPFASMRVGPGTAPQALVYGLRVFGCGGGTGLTVQAIDWAMDPNGDSDLSDHLDVINMSLGSNFGGLANTSAMAADNAARAGVIVVTSAGNAGDTYFISGAPGAASRAIATAASVDAGLPGPILIVNAPAGVAGTYAAGTASFGPPAPTAGLTGDVVSALDPSDADGPLTTDACSPLTNAAAVAGKIALLDRGTCAFTVKVKHAQDAGAIAVVVVYNQPGVAPGMGGSDPAVVIPSVMISQADGTTLRAQEGAPLNVTLVSNADTLGSFSSRGPRRGPGPIALKPDIAAPGVSITSAQTGVTCTATGCQRPDASGFLPGSQALVLQGTSMASPHVAGIMALLRQLHPTWTVEELKALAMNSALHDVTSQPAGQGDRYGPGRVGAGRVDPLLAALSPVVAYNAEDPGLVSVSFDIPEVVGTRTQTKTVRLVNQGTTPQTYDLGVDTVVNAPGISFAIPGSSAVTVPPGQTIDVAVDVTAIAADMDHSREATVSATQSVASPASLASLQIPRHWLTEESGYLTLSQASTTRLRVPLHATARPASQMNAVNAIPTGGASTGSTTLPLLGTEVCTGTPGGAACAGSFPTDVASLVSPFELQVISPRDPTLPAYQDLQYVGVAADNTRIWFGVSTWGDWSSPTDVAFNIYVDVNSDGVYDRVIVNTNSGALSRVYFGQPGQSDLDTFITTVFTPPTTFSNTIAASTPNFVNRLNAAAIDSALFNSNVMFIGATPAQLGMTDTSGQFRYKIETCPGSTPVCQSIHGFHLDEAPGPYSWNGAARGLDFSGVTLGADLNGGTIPVTWNTANMTSNGSLGALLLHHHNQAGQRAQVVPLDTTPRTDLNLTFSATPSAPTFGQNTTLTLTVTNASSVAATGVVVTVDLPPGLTYVSSSGSVGVYDSSLGEWTVGPLGSGANGTLQIVATADTVGPMQALAAITSVTPLDTVAANNQAVLTFNTPGQTDLQITAVPSAPTVLAGSPVGYTVTVTNGGPEPAHNVAVGMTFTAGAGTIQSGTPSTGVFDAGSGVWNIASLGPGVSATLTLSGLAIGGPTLTAQAQATSPVADSNSSNNVALASIAVTARATTLTTALSPTSVLAGESSTFTVTITDTESIGTKSNPAGTVTLASSIPSDLLSSASCALVPVPATTDQASCAITVNTTAASVHTITATYAGTDTHAAGTASSDLTVDLRPTTTTAANASAMSSPAPQNVTLTANVTSSLPVDAGTVTFTVRDAANAIVGVPATSAALIGGTATVAYVLPGGTIAQTLSVTAEYSGGGVFASSTGAPATLTIDLRPTTTTAADATAVSDDEPTNVTLTANVASGLPGDTGPVSESPNEGTVTFTVRDAANAIVGVPVTSAAVTGGAASAVYVLPGGTAAQTLHITADYSGTGLFDDSSDATKTLTVTAAPILTLTYLLAEGATGPFFDLDVLIVNPNDAAAPVTLTFLKEDGTTVTQDRTLDPLTRTTIRVDDIAGLEATAMSTVVASTQGLPLVVERTMRWDATGYGAHTEKATLGPALTWYFAEGSQGFFSTFLLLANPALTPNTAHVTYFREGEPAVVRDYALLPSSRTTIAAGDDAALVDRAFGAQVSFDLPGLAERATYFGTSPVWSGGHASAGTTAPAQQWLLAEGATGAYFATYLLLANPNPDPANVTVTYLPAVGDPIVRTHPVPGLGRTTISIADEDPALASAAVGARVEADRPIVVERAQYWPQPEWIEGHSSAGVTEAGMRWGLAEGQVGGPTHRQTYILLANPGTEAATVTLRLLRTSGVPIVKTFTVQAASRVNVAIAGAGSDVPELADEAFGAVIESTQPIVAERSVYWDVGGVTWSAGTNATATRLPDLP